MQINRKGGSRGGKGKAYPKHYINTPWRPPPLSHHLFQPPQPQSSKDRPLPWSRIPHTPKILLIASKTYTQPTKCLPMITTRHYYPPSRTHHIKISPRLPLPIHLDKKTIKRKKSTFYQHINFILDFFCTLNPIYTHIISPIIF